MGDGLCVDGHLCRRDTWDADCCCVDCPRECCPEHSETLPAPHPAAESLLAGVA